MTSLRSNLKVNVLNQPKNRRHRAPAKPNRQPTKKATRKTRPTANIVSTPSRTPSQDTNSVDSTQNTRHGQRARDIKSGSIDSLAVLRNKRRWVQREFEAERIGGKATRELHDLYSKRNAGSVRRQRVLARNLTEAAKEAKLRLEEVFDQAPVAAPAVGAASQPLGNNYKIAGRISSATRIILDDSHANIHQALAEPGDRQAVAEPPRDDAAGLEAGGGMSSKGDTETEDGSSSDEEDLMNHPNQVTVVPRSTAEQNDTTARQQLLDLGIQLADYSAARQDADTQVGDTDEVGIRREADEDE